MIRTKVLGTTDSGERIVQCEYENGDVLTSVTDHTGRMVDAVLEEWNSQRAARRPTILL